MNQALFVNRGIDSLQRIIPFQQLAPKQRGPGETLPWHDPEFSVRMLSEHLDQSSDQASRPKPVISKQVEFLTQTRLLTPGCRVLDLGCGPGLYAEAMSETFPVDYIGLDCAPAALAYAQALQLQATPKFELADLLESTYPDQCDLIVLMYDLLNAFSSRDARQLLDKSAHALSESGSIFLELITAFPFSEYTSSWFVRDRGLFGDDPYLELIEEGTLECQLLGGHRHLIYSFSSSQLIECKNFRRIYPLQELVDMARECNLAITHVWWGEELYELGVSSKDRMFVALSRGPDQEFAPTEMVDGDVAQNAADT
jgi:SAM-dependent methyltransferase